MDPLPLPHYLDILVILATYSQEVARFLAPDRDPVATPVIIRLSYN